MDWTRLPLSRATVDRAAHRRRDPEALESAWQDPRTRVVLLRGGGLAVTDVAGADGQAARELDLRPAVDLPHLGPGRRPGVLHLLLGEDDGAPVVAAVLPDAPGGPGRPDTVDIEGVVVTDDPVPGLRWAGLRDVGHALGDRDAGLAAAAVGLAAWHERHPRCARCGAPTDPDQSGWTRRCREDGSEHYPRTDPAVIMAVVDDADRLLLGHAAHWPPRRFSTLAGYVEPGESLEAAVRREVREEVGVDVGALEYRGSQPWPFPASLMLAFVAHATTTALTVDGEEVTEARWFTREALASAVADGEVLLPMRTSVARALIEEWLGGTLTEPSR